MKGEVRRQKKLTALDDLQAVLIITKHLDTLLPWLLALKRVPNKIPQRVGLIQRIARDIAENVEIAQDWYHALELLSGEDLSTRSVVDLMELSVKLLAVEKLGDVWSTAYQIGLIDEKMMQQWIVADELRSPQR